MSVTTKNFHPENAPAGIPLTREGPGRTYLPPDGKKETLNVWLQDSANRVHSNMLRLLKAKYYYHWAVQAYPPITLGVFRQNPGEQVPDISIEIRRIQERLRHLASELSIRQATLLDARENMPSKQ